MVRVDEHGHRMPGHKPVFFSMAPTEHDVASVVRYNAESDGRWMVYCLDPIGVFVRSTISTVTRLPNDYNAPDHD